MQRLFQVVSASRFDVIFLQRDLLYRVPSPFLESLLFQVARKSGARLIFDIDDAIFLGKDGIESPALRRKIQLIAARSDLIVAGNDYLKNELALPEKTIVIPTCIDTARFSPRKISGTTPKPIIGWTGLASNLHYLKPLEEVLNSLSKDFEFELHLICEKGASSPFGSPEFKYSFIPWNEEIEVEALKRLDIGLMPLQDDAWSRGKCAFKILQYMACGVAPVASAVGMNTEVITHGENGLLCETAENWKAALEQLLSDVEYRNALSLKAVQTVQEHYSIQRWYPRWKNAVLGESVSTPS